MKKKLLATVLCMAMVLTCLAGCGGEDKGDQGADGVKKIVYANGGQPESMEFVEGSRYAKYSVLKYNIYTGLTRISKDGTSEMGWADKYETSDDGLVWTFHIREDAKFSDGTDMTAHDWEETMKYYCAPKTAAQQTTLEEYVKNMGAYIAGECEWKDVGYKALDDRTLEITLENPCTYFLDIACTYVALPMHIVNENPNWNKTAETYVGNGPFRMASLKDQVNVVLEKNPYYYDTDNVAIDQVEFVFLDEPSVELASFQNGDIDVSDNLNAEAVSKYKDSEEFVNESRIGVNYLTIHTGHITDNRVRQALSLALDRETLLQILGQVSFPATGLVPYGIHWGDEQYRDKAGDLVSFNLERAKKLLEEAGYPNGEGLPTFKYVCQNNEEAMNRAQAMQSMWQAAGFKIEIVSYEPSTYWDVFETENWDIADDGWTGDYDDPSTNLFLWEERREVNPDGSLKDARWHDEKALEYNALMQKTYKETDYETRMKTFLDAEKILVEETPIIPVTFYTDTMLVNPKVKGVVKNYIGHVFFQYADIAE